MSNYELNKYDKAAKYIIDNYDLSCEECKKSTGSSSTCAEWMKKHCKEEQEMFNTCLDALEKASKNLYLKSLIDKINHSPVYKMPEGNEYTKNKKRM